MTPSSQLSASATPATTQVPFWINGARTGAHSARFGDVTNPTSGEVIRQVPLADATDVDHAVHSAVEALPAWRATTAVRRARILASFRALLEDHQKELAALI